MPATCLSELDVVILAGGFGTRLRSVVADRPKVLAPIDGVPFLRRYLDWLSAFGARRVILALGYRAEMVQDFVKSQDWAGMEIDWFVESTPLGTGGAVRAVLPQIRSQAALVTNGDSVTKVDLCRFVEFHRGHRARLSMLLTLLPNVTQSGLVETAENGEVISFREKPSEASAGYINAGMYLIEREAIAEFPGNGPVSIEKDIFPRFCGRGFFAMKGDFPFIDIGTPESYSRAASFFAAAT